MFENKKVQFFQELISCNYPLYFWKYDTDANLLTSNCPDESFFDGLFRLSQGKKQLMQYASQSDLPLLLSDSFGLMWSAVFEKEKERISAIYVMGPAFINQNSPRHIEQKIDHFHLTVERKLLLLSQLKHIPLLNSSTFFQYTLMFHYALRKERLCVGDLQRTLPETSQVTPAAAPTDHPHQGINNVESELFAMVEQGNLNYEEVLNKAQILSTGIRANLGDPIQQGKFSAISFLTLCSRSAIKGGLSATMAYDLCDMYTKSIDECKTLTEMTLVNHTMYEDFITRVHKCKHDNHYSKTVQTCCDYISMHLTDELNIEILADIVGYTAYYLSRKFKKETGTSINSYIRSAKIDYSKTLLTTTQTGIQDISTMLHFCSRSYYADMFLKQVGMSPSEYREKNKSF